MDFKELNARLLSNISTHLNSWFPAGKVNGRKYELGSLRGEEGKSLKIDLEAGFWNDFATGEKGGDLISLYAASWGYSQIESARKICAELGIEFGNKLGIEFGNKSEVSSKYEGPENRSELVKSPPSGPKTIFKDVSKDNTNHGENTVHDSGAGLVYFAKIPPPGLPPLVFKSQRYGKAVATYTYKTRDGRDHFYISRYEAEDGKKHFTPTTWDGNGWNKKAHHNPRPLFGLEFLDQKPTAPILICEGEKSALAAREFAGPYIVMTWPNGTGSVQHADWSQIYRRKILIWPDHDEQKNPDGSIRPKQDQPGHIALTKIISALIYDCPEVKVIDVYKNPAPLPGWDAADSGFKTFQEFREWAAPLTITVPVPITPQVLGPIKDRAPTPEGYPAKLQQSWYDLGLDTTPATGAPYISESNCVQILANYNEFIGVFYYDEFLAKFMCHWPGEEIRPMKDSDALEALISIQKDVRVQKMSHQVMGRAIKAHALRDTRNCVKDYLNSLTWDQVPRVNTFFHTYFGSELNDYSSVVSKNFFVGMIARAMEPGCKMDNMVVIEGIQGIMKSTALSVIGGPWYVTTVESFSSKDFLQVIQGALLIEISELGSMSKAEIKIVKNTITTATDKFRAPYASHPEEHPRKCVFVGTTNDDEYLNDPTGARRFWPIKALKIDIEKLKQDRDQLFAEALHLYKTGAIWFERPPQSEEEQEERMTKDPWEPLIQDWLYEKESDMDFFGRITTTMIQYDALKISPSNMDYRTTARVRAIMKRLGYKAIRRRDRKERHYSWEK